MCNNCNPCDDCAPKCHECCNPNIQGDGCVTVDQSEEGVITISAPCPTQVTSEDGSVEVKEKTPDEGYSKRFDLSVPENDRKVGACGGDTNPGPLNDKIRVTGALTMATKNCPGDGYIELGVDASKLNIPDVKVAVNSGCEGKYLSDALKCTADNLEFSVSGCTMTLRNKAPQYASGKIILQESVKGTVGWNQIGRFVLCESSFPTKPSGATTLPASFSLADLSHNMHYEGGALVCEKPGLYQVGFSTAFECGFGVHGMRVLLHHVKYGGGHTTVAESRYSGPVGLTPYEMRMSTNQAYNTMYIAKNTEVDGVQGLSASLGGVLDRMDCGHSTIIEMGEGDALMIGVVVQASTTYSGEYLNWDNSEGKFAIIGNSGSQAGTGLGAQIYAYLLNPL